MLQLTQSRWETPRIYGAIEKSLVPTFGYD
jgi:hypothetical protein